MKDFTPYELALELKQLGFDEPCFAFYDESLYFPNNENQYGTFCNQKRDASSCSAPTYSQAFRWFREKYNLYQDISAFAWNYDKKQLGFSIRTYLNPVNIETERKVYGEVYETYEEAELACLKKLIEIVKENAN
jgi:hypothetical protein